MNDKMRISISEWSRAINEIAALKAERDALENEIAKLKEMCNLEELRKHQAITERDELKTALNELQDAEAYYRNMHDTSPIKLDIGRAWDLMRRAGSKARKLLEEIK